jgi:hypothetical protein
MLGYIEVSDHPLSIALRKNHQEIIKEFNILSERFLSSKPNNIMGKIVDQKESNGKMLYQGLIKSVFTRIVKESCSPNEEEAVWGTTEESRLKAEDKFKLKRSLSPTLEKILEPYHPYVGTVGFNLMCPGSKLSMHYGMISKYVRFHLGLICDSEAKFIVNDYEPRAWETGKVWAFDDGDAFHGTVHNGQQERVILLIDIHKDAFSELKEEITWY